MHWTDGESSYGLGDSFVLEGDVVLSAVWQDYILHEVTFVSGGQVLSAKTVRDGEPCIIDADAGTTGTKTICQFTLETRLNRIF